MKKSASFFSAISLIKTATGSVDALLAFVPKNEQLRTKASSLVSNPLFSSSRWSAAAFGQDRGSCRAYSESTGGGAMIMDKYGAKERLPVALRSSGTEFEEVRIESEPAIPNTKTGAAPSSCEKSSAT